MQMNQDWTCSSMFCLYSFFYFLYLCLFVCETALLVNSQMRSFWIQMTVSGVRLWRIWRPAANQNSSER